MRKIYLDNIRFGTILIVMIYHVFYLFNSVGVPGGIGSFTDVQYQDALLYFVYPWFMVLLFVIAGMSAKYALDKKSIKNFIQSRTSKLLVPSTLGLFAFHWIVGYFYIKIGGGLEFMPKFIVYPISSISGIGPLWFIQMLWLFSLLIILIKKVDKNDKLLYLCKKCNLTVVILLFIPLWISSHILNMPVLTMYRFGIYFTSFLIGYFILSDTAIQNKIEKLHILLISITIIMGVAYTYIFFGKDYTSATVLESLFTNAYAWISVLAILGTSKAWANKENKFTKYMVKSSYGFYILHYAVTLIPCYYLKTSGLPTALVYFLALIIVFTATPILYEMIKRIPIYRYFVLGIRRNDNVKR